MASAAQKTNALIHRRLYRALLRAVKPFTPPSPNAAVLSCLLHRSFIPLEVDETLARRKREGRREPDSYVLDHYMVTNYDDFFPEHNDDYDSDAGHHSDLFDDADDDHDIDSDDDTALHSSHDNLAATLEGAVSPKRYDDQFLLFRRLLWMIFSDGHAYNHKSSRKIVRCYQFPNQVHRQPYKLRDVIRREFRVPAKDDEEEEEAADLNNNNNNNNNNNKRNSGTATATSTAAVAVGSGRYFSAAFPVKARREAAFLALRKLNEKLAWAEQLEGRQKQQKQQQQQQQNQQIHKQAAKHVEPILIPPPTRATRSKAKSTTSSKRHKQRDISSYLQPGTFLLAHPHMSGYFRRSVICILQHGSSTSTNNSKDTNPKIKNKNDDDRGDYITSSAVSDDDDDDDDHNHNLDDIPTRSSRQEKRQKREDDFGTYGIIVNRVSLVEHTGRTRTVTDVLPFLPKEIVVAFGGLPMKEGGPVHMPSIQMLHSTTPPTTPPAAVTKNDATKTTITTKNTEITASSSSKTPPHNNNESDDGEQDSNIGNIGGVKLPRVLLDNVEEKTVLYRGDIMAAAEAVKLGHLDRDDVSFFAGASCWYPGQLEKEIKQGCWLPCRGPPEIALTGVCEHDLPSEEGEPRPKADLWLSMMSACGEDEAKLARLVELASEEDEYGAACDDF